MSDSNLYNNDNINHRVNFMSADKKTAINSYGEVFYIGNVVGHQEGDAGNTVITGFEFDVESNEVKAITKNGYAHIDFIYNIFSDDTIPFGKDESCEMTSTFGIELVKKERMEQIEKHGFSVEDDAKFYQDELVQLAMFCAQPGVYEYPKNMGSAYKERILKKTKINQLAISAALIIAEIDKLKHIELRDELNAVKSTKLEDGLGAGAEYQKTYGKKEVNTPKLEPISDGEILELLDYAVEKYGHKKIEDGTTTRLPEYLTGIVDTKNRKLVPYLEQ